MGEALPLWRGFMREAWLQFSDVGNGGLWMRIVGNQSRTFAKLLKVSKWVIVCVTFILYVFVSPCVGNIIIFSVVNNEKYS